MKTTCIIIVVTVLLYHSKAVDKNKNMFRPGSKLNIENIKSAIEIMASDHNFTVHFVKDYGGRVLKKKRGKGQKIQTDATLKVEANDTILDTRCSFEFEHTYYLKEEDTTLSPSAPIYDLYYHNMTLSSYYCDEIDGFLLTYP